MVTEWGCTEGATKCWSGIDTWRHNHRKYFTEKPFPFRAVMWYPRSKANKTVHLSCWKFSLGPAPCSIHLLDRLIYPWLIWLFRGGCTTAVNSLSRQENVHDTGSFIYVIRHNSIALNSMHHSICNYITCNKNMLNGWKIHQMDWIQRWLMSVFLFAASW